MDRLSELAKQIQDGINELRGMVPLIGMYLDGETGQVQYHLAESVFLGTFNNYTVVRRDGDKYLSEFYAYVNGTKFFTISKIELPAGKDKIVILQPERVAV